MLKLKQFCSDLPFITKKIQFQVKRIFVEELQDTVEIEIHAQAKLFRLLFILLRLMDGNRRLLVSSLFLSHSLSNFLPLSAPLFSEEKNPTLSPDEGRKNKRGTQEVKHRQKTEADHPPFDLLFVLRVCVCVCVCVFLVSSLFPILDPVWKWQFPLDAFLFIW